MSISSEQIKLVKSSLKHIVNKSGAVADDFYDNLFERSPAAKSLFKTDMIEQKSKLMATIITVMESLDEIQVIRNLLADLGKRHLDYKVSKDDYGIAGEALLFSLEKNLGSDFTEEIKDAWHAAYAVAAEIMMSSYPK